MSDRPALDVGALLAALIGAGVEFIVVGGFAVSAHGYPRATKDLDIVPDPDPVNLGRLADLLTELGASILGLEDFDPGELGIEPDLAGLEGGGNFLLSTSLGRLDVMQEIAGPGVTYADLDDAAIADTVFGHRVRFCGYDDLVRMKEAAGRPEDVLDLQRLREARGEEG